MNNYKVINKQNLIHNVNFCKTKNKKIMAMVKANAYGHNYKIVCNILKKYINYFGVANEVEAIKLRKYLKNKSIVVVGKTKDFKALILNEIEITVDEIGELYKINQISKKLNKKAYVHIAINTGMNRIGVKNTTQFKRLLNYISLRKNIVLKGVFTHFFDADSKRSNFYKQMEVFESFINIAQSQSNNLLIHVGGSYCLNYTLPKWVNMVRVGLFLYGYGNKNLKKVMTIKSRVIKITNVKSGGYVGYGKTRLKQDKTIALVPIGYADGINRCLSNKAYVKINGKNCKIIGKICMDMFMCDITNKNVQVGNSVCILPNSKFSQVARTNIYEILTNFNSLRGKEIINNHIIK